MNETNAAIRIYLLRSQPEVWINDTLHIFEPQVLKLLIALLNDQTEIHSRDQLITSLYGVIDEQTRETFRKKALYPLRQSLPGNAIQKQGNGLLRFQVSNLWVDSIEFLDRANALLQNSDLFDSAKYQEAKAVLALYRAPYLGDFQIRAADGVEHTTFVLHQKQKQSELSKRYHTLLEHVVEFLLRQQETWGEARDYAERLRRSPTSGVKPLHYLIWLGIQQRSSDLHQYLEELREREKTEIRIGRSWKDWNEVISRGWEISIDELFSTIPPRLTLPEYKRIDTLDQVVKLLTSPREQPIFGLVGLAGSGKTELSRAVVQELQQNYPDHPAILVELTTSFDHVAFCNSIFMELGKQDLLPLDIGRKKQRLKHLLQTPNQIVIVDEGHSKHLANPQVIYEIREMLHGARIMLVARQLPAYVFYEIALEGLSPDQVRNFILDEVSWLKISDSDDFQTLTELTFGLPLALNIIVGGLNRHRVRLPSLIEHLQVSPASTTREESVIQMYKHLIGWLWQYLQPQEKNVLFTMSLFAPEEGAGVQALSDILKRVSTLSVVPHLRNLSKLRLITHQKSKTDEDCYALHPIVLEFVKEQINPANKHVERIKRVFVEYILDYSTLYHNDFAKLDDHKQSLLHVLEQVFMTDQYATLQAQAVNTLSLLHPFFERSGLYANALTFLTYVTEHMTLPETVMVEMLFQKGKLAKFLGKLDVALHTFKSALMIAQALELHNRYGSLYNNMGDLLMQRAAYTEALQAFENAERWAKEIQYLPLLYTVWSNVAGCYFYQGQFELAQSYYEKVAHHLGDEFDTLADIFKRIAQHNQNALGLNAIELGEYQNAISYFQRGLDLANQLNYQEQTGYLYLNLGVAYYFLGEFANAAHSFTQARAIAEAMQHVWLLADVQRNQGILASAQFLHTEAFQLLRQSLILIEDNDLTVSKAQVLTALGKAYLRIENYESGQLAFKNALLAANSSLKYTTQALYGLILSALMRTHPIGDKQVTTARTLIDELLTELPIDTHEFFNLSFDIAKRHLEKAGSIFSYELNHLPSLSRYCIVEALCQWFREGGQNIRYRAQETAQA